MGTAIGPIGIWASGMWCDGARAAEAADVASELDDLGFAALWVSAGFGDGIPAAFAGLLDATRRMSIATGILSIWHSTPVQSAEGFAALEKAHPGRFLLGLGASHAVVVDSPERNYERPFSRMVGYLDDLAVVQPAVPPSGMVLAALGPRMLALAADRTAGAHPYFVPVEHTEQARSVLGVGPMLAPELAVVVEVDPEKARAAAREHMSVYLGLPNYTNNLRRFGYGDDDLGGGGSDRLVDAIVAWGDLDQIASRVRAHRDAGADHVSLQVLTADPQQFPREQYRALAEALI
ncbi:MAG: TIGR03620 family F420-dependent LLM class oxidoreductase [Actinobacteria bacterium]|nr:TIGR03620 family F420-dependent LLM class oxidoreductase [Actinomycetota bacterium]MSW37002.1 TIGR03620 family F420-dependent LLM class oxidoreductase [Actinomycetota bacterium]